MLKAVLFKFSWTTVYKDKLIRSQNDNCKLRLFLAGIIILHYITAGIHNSQTETAYLTTSIKEIVAEMSDTPLKQIFSRRRCAMCCIVTPAALVSRWEIVLMFSITASLLLHQDPSKMFWQVNMRRCTPPPVRHFAKVEEKPILLPVVLTAKHGKKWNGTVLPCKSSALERTGYTVSLFGAR